tara:strand:+ start:156 stop:341 length:186 start_codon:yes stop_codon:yes gene_type:complete
LLLKLSAAPQISDGSAGETDKAQIAKFAKSKVIQTNIAQRAPKAGIYLMDKQYFIASRCKT